VSLIGRRHNVAERCGGPGAATPGSGPADRLAGRGPRDNVSGGGSGATLLKPKRYG